MAVGDFSSQKLGRVGKPETLRVFFLSPIKEKHICMKHGDINFKSACHAKTSKSVGYLVTRDKKHGSSKMVKIAQLHKGLSQYGRLRGIQQHGKYNYNFDVSSKGPSSVSYSQLQLSLQFAF